MDTILGYLPREALDAPSLKVSKARLDEALANLIQRVASLPMAGWLEFKVLSNLSCSLISSWH